MYTNQHRDVFTTMGLGFRVDKAAATLPASTTQDLFVISGGLVLVTLVIGEVTTAIQGQACNLSVVFDATAGGDVTLASVLDIDADVLGSLYLVEGDGSALKQDGGGLLNAIGASPMVLSEGEIHILTSATSTGATKWICFYFPLDEGAAIVSA